MVTLAVFADLTSQRVVPSRSLPAPQDGQRIDELDGYERPWRLSDSAVDGLPLGAEHSADTKRSRYAAVEAHDLVTTSARRIHGRPPFQVPFAVHRAQAQVQPEAPRPRPQRGRQVRPCARRALTFAGLTGRVLFELALYHSDHTLTSPTRATSNSGTPHAPSNLFLKGVAPLGTAVANAASYAINSATLVVGGGGGGGGASNSAGGSSAAASKRRSDTIGPSTSASIAALTRARSPQPGGSSGLGGPPSMSRTLSSSMRSASPSHSGGAGTADLAGHRSRSDSDGRRLLEAMRSAAGDPREAGAVGHDLRPMRTAAYRTQRALHRTPTDPLANPAPLARAPSLLRAGSSHTFHHRRSASLTTSAPASADAPLVTRAGSGYRAVSQTSSGSLDAGSVSADSLLAVVASAAGYNASGSSSGAPVGASSLTESPAASPETPTHAPLTQSAPPTALREM